MLDLTETSCINSFADCLLCSSVVVSIYGIKYIKAFLSSLFYTEGIVPGPPLDLHVTEATKNYIVLGWKPPFERGHEGVMYFVEKVKLQCQSIVFSFISPQATFYPQTKNSRLVPFSFFDFFHSTSKAKISNQC